MVHKALFHISNDQFRFTSANLLLFCQVPFLCRGFLTASHPFTLIALSRLITVEALTETRVDFFGVEEKVKFDFPHLSVLPL